MAANLQRLSPLARTGAQFGTRALYQSTRQGATTLARPLLTQAMPTPQATTRLATARMPQARRLHSGNPAVQVQMSHRELAALFLQTAFPREQPLPLPTVNTAQVQRPQPLLGLAGLIQLETEPATNVVHSRELKPEEEAPAQEGIIYQDMGIAPNPLDDVTLEVTLPKEPSSLSARIAYGLGTALAFIVALPFRIAFFPVKKTYDLGVYLLTPKKFKQEL